MLNNWRVYVGSYSLLLFWRVVGFYSYGYSTPEITQPPVLPRKPVSPALEVTSEYIRGQLFPSTEISGGRFMNHAAPASSIAERPGKAQIVAGANFSFSRVWNGSYPRVTHIPHNVTMVPGRIMQVCCVACNRRPCHIHLSTLAV